jgi:hypothetical protein
MLSFNINHEEQIGSLKASGPWRFAKSGKSQTEMPGQRDRLNRHPTVPVAVYHAARGILLFREATCSDRLRGKRRKAKPDHLVEGRFSVLLKFDDEARMAEEASGVDETCRECGVSRRKLA